jgi:dTDP-4-amino-4,6-dideoxygalactose transaminase
MISRRKELRSRYKEFFAEVPGVIVLGARDDMNDNSWLTSILIDPEVAGFSPTELADHLSAAGIEARPLWKPMHLQPIFTQARGVITGVAESLFISGLTLPSGSSLIDLDHQRIFDTLESFLRDCGLQAPGLGSKKSS